MQLLDSKSPGMTPTGLTKALRGQHPDLSRGAIRRVIKSLVERGELNYSNRFGRTYIELNYFRAMRITDRIILAPSNRKPAIQPGELLVKINNGASFGMGDHPTTRIALRAVEYAMSQLIREGQSQRLTALDIGTGSGVLAIASIKLGAAKAFGLDHDPLACHEARKNVTLNKLDSVVSIHQTDLQHFSGGRCELIMANLRPPTLKQIIPFLHQFSAPSALWVFTGFREEESHGLNDFVTGRSSSIIRQIEEHGWHGIVVGWEDLIDNQREWEV